MLLVAVGAALCGLDLYFSHRRLTLYGARIELNPVARQLAADHSVWAALLFLAAYNAVLLYFVGKYHDFGELYVGFRAGIAALQLKSLETELWFEKLLKKAKEKHHVT